MFACIVCISILFSLAVPMIGGSGYVSNNINSDPVPQPSTVPIMMLEPYTTDVSSVSFSVAGACDVPVDVEVEVSQTQDFVEGTGTTFVGADGVQDNLVTGIYMVHCSGLMMHIDYYYRVKLTNGPDTIYYPAQSGANSTVWAMPFGGGVSYDLPDPACQAQEGMHGANPGTVQYYMLYRIYLTGPVNSTIQTYLDYPGNGFASFAGDNFKDLLTHDYVHDSTGCTWHTEVYGLYDDGVTGLVFWKNDTLTQPDPPVAGFIPTDPPPWVSSLGYWDLYNGVNYRTFTCDITPGWNAQALTMDIIAYMQAQYGETISVENDITIGRYDSILDSFVISQWSMFGWPNNFDLKENETYLIEIRNGALSTTPRQYEPPNSIITSPIAVDLYNGRSLRGVPVTTLNTAKELALDIIDYLDLTYGEIVGEDEIRISRYDSYSSTHITCRKGTFGWANDFILNAEEGYWIEINDGILTVEPREYIPSITKRNDECIALQNQGIPAPSGIPNLWFNPITTDVQDYSFTVAGVADIAVDVEVEVSTVIDFPIGSGDVGVFSGVNGSEDNFSSGAFRVVCGQLPAEETEYHYRVKLTNGGDVLYYPALSGPGSTVSVTTGNKWYFSSNPDPMYQTQDWFYNVQPYFLYLSWVTGSDTSYPISLIDYTGQGFVTFSGENLRSTATGVGMLVEAGEIWHANTHGFGDDGVFGWYYMWNDTFSEMHPPGDEILICGGPMHHQAFATGPVSNSASLGPFNITYIPNCGCWGLDDIYFSNDGNATWNYIDTTTWPTDQYSWTAPGPGTYWWIVNGDQMMGAGYNWPAPGTPAEAGPYVIGDTYDISLSEGWNLISTPYELADEGINQALSSIAGQWDCIQTYDPLDPEPWQCTIVYRPPQMNDISEINHKMGFWINITEPGGTILSVFGLPPPLTSIPIYAGWNLVGYPSLNDTTTVAEALFGTGADHVEVFDPVEPYRIKEVGPTYVMQPGEGYWIHVPMDTIWTIDW